MHACMQNQETKKKDLQDIAKNKNAYLSHFINDLGWVAGAKRVDQLPKYDRHERLR